jgi:hypothetical protein
MGLTHTEAERTLAELQHGRWDYRTRETTQLDELAERLYQVAAWCARFLDLGAIAVSLRPMRLAPHSLYKNRWDAVDDVALERARDLPGFKRTDSKNVSGKLLVYFPDADLADGAAEAETNGFLDVHNAPPWGTWVGYFEDGNDDQSYSSYLIAWIPSSLAHLVDGGIEVNPEACITWLDETNVRLREVLEHVEFPWSRLTHR